MHCTQTLSCDSTVRGFGAMGLGRVDESVAHSLKARCAPSSERCRRRTSIGLHPGSMANCSRSGLMCHRRWSSGTWSGNESHHRRAGAPSSPITLMAASPSISARCPSRHCASCRYISCSRTLVVTSCISRLRNISACVWWNNSSPGRFLTDSSLGIWCVFAMRIIEKFTCVA
jgi:hypothetical protein